MLTQDHPGSEIAVGMQLKHVAARALANRTTQGFMARDPKLAHHLTQAIAERRYQRLKDLFDADRRGESIGFGPGSDRMREAFAAVRHQAEQLRSTGQAQRGDARVEHDLLRRTRISIRFGKLNHCTMNDDDPTGAKCIEDAVVPDGHRGPLTRLDVRLNESASSSEGPAGDSRPRTEQALREATERLFAGRPERTDEKLTKNNLWREAVVSRATMNRATTVLAEWDTRAATNPAALHQRRHDYELTILRTKLRKSEQERRQLQGQVDAAATRDHNPADRERRREQSTRQSATSSRSPAPALPIPGERAVRRAASGTHAADHMATIRALATLLRPQSSRSRRRRA